MSEFDDFAKESQDTRPPQSHLENRRRESVRLTKTVESMSRAEVVKTALGTTAVITHKKNRRFNQDSFLADPNRGFWLVVDGAGGVGQNNAGGRAADTLVATANQMLDLHQDMAEIGQATHQKLKHQPHAAACYTGVEVVSPGKLRVLTTGDTRAVLIRDNQITHKTTDEAKGNMLRSAVTSEVSVGPTQEHWSYGSGDRLILASDGLWKQIQQYRLEHTQNRPQLEQLRQLLNQTPPDQAVERLIDLLDLSQYPKPDNITILIHDFT